MKDRSVTPEAAYRLIKSIGPRLGYDYTRQPVFPEGRDDVCAVSHMTENGSTYGYDTVYLVFRDKSGELRHIEIFDTRDTKDYCHIRSVTADGNHITVDFGSGGSFSGDPWDLSYNIDI